MGRKLCLLISSNLSHPGGTSGKEPACRRCKRLGFDPRFSKIRWRRKRQPTPVLLPGESPGQRSLVHTVRRAAKSRTGLSRHKKDLPTHPLWEGCLVPSRADRSQKSLWVARAGGRRTSPVGRLVRGRFILPREAGNTGNCGGGEGIGKAVLGPYSRWQLKPSQGKGRNCQRGQGSKTEQRNRD